MSNIVHWIFIQFVCGYFCNSNAYEVYRLPERHNITHVNGLKFLSPYISNFAIGEHKRLVLRCQVRTDREPNFEWVRIENSTSAKVIRNNTDDGRYLIFVKRRQRRRGDTYNNKLVIRNTQASDSGVIKCRVNVRGSAVIERQFKVNVGESILTPIRLESYTQRGEGLLRIRLKNKWTYFHYNTFSSVKASIVCRSLGYPYGGVARNTYEERTILGHAEHHVYKSEKYNPYCIYGISCFPNVTDIVQCQIIKQKKCYSPHVLGITCRLEPVKIPDVPVRLLVPGMGVLKLQEGVVEVFLDGHWGFVNINYIGQSEVHALCQTLGFKYGGESYKATDIYFKFNSLDYTNPILRNLSCSENALHFNECNHTVWGDRTLDSSWDILAIKCWTHSEIYDSGVQVRLAGSNIEHEGRVEILHNNVWGTVNDYWYGYPGANVLCKMLGYPYGGVPKFERIAPGQGPTWIDFIECPLDANDLQDCEFEWVKSEEDIHRSLFGSAFIKCRTEPVEVPEVKFRLNGTWSGQGIGILEYFKDGYWGYVCGAYMGTSEASMFCHQLGFTKGGRLLFGYNNYGYRKGQNHFKHDIGPTILKYIECPWDSVELDQCSERLWAYKDDILSCEMHTLDVKLKCNTEPFPDYEIQLFGGNSNNSGQLLVKYENTWLKVTPERFEIRNVAVVCRQLGFRHGGEMHVNMSIYENSKNWLKLVCNGQEQNVGQCNGVHRLSSNAWYSYRSAAVFIECYDINGPELKMTVSLKSDGKVNVHRLGATWQICASAWNSYQEPLWDDVGATAVCRMLNNSFSNATATHIPYDYKGFPATANNIQQLYCPRGASHLGDCFYGGYISYKESKLASPWQPGACREEDSYYTLTRRGGVRCNI
ncbi:egg peptide speract receptor-like [Mytilus californianus]|uniref:egg peptide speract receptor-like n=1 Tax=Mytilus californianus TaxID=6549 RepID=UPI002247AC1F|nr:egg peptide speract receptor-like [Mytilus californianus]